MTEPHDILCEYCLEYVDQCLDPDCTESDHHTSDGVYCDMHCQSLAEER